MGQPVSSQIKWVHIKSAPGNGSRLNWSHHKSSQQNSSQDTKCPRLNDDDDLMFYVQYTQNRTFDLKYQTMNRNKNQERKRFCRISDEPVESGIG